MINRKKKNRVLERIRKASRRVNWIILLFPFFLHGQDLKTLPLDSFNSGSRAGSIGGFAGDISAEASIVIDGKIYGSQDTIPAVLYILENGEEKMISGYITGNPTIFLDAKKRRVKVTKFRL